MTDLRLGGLDQSPISESMAPSEALHNSVDLARHTEELGYHRYWVAETFSMLSGLHPGRIDLGLGRAPGTDQLTMLALQRDRRQLAADDFREHLAELLGYLDGRLPAEHPFVRLAGVLPGRPHRPEPWLLGSSPQSAVWSAELGLPYCFADFIDPQGAAIVDDFRQRFTPSEAERVPRARRSASWRSARRQTRRPSASRPATGWPSRCFAKAG